MMAMNRTTTPALCDDGENENYPTGVNLMESRTERNRKNALQSTGPKTPGGKAISSHNAVKHGAYSESLTMLLECPEEFEKLNAGMMDSLRPVGPMEAAIVDRMASLWWRAERAKRTANQVLWMAAKARLLDPLPPLDSPILIARATEMAIEADSCRLANAWDIDRQERLLRHEVMLEREFFASVMNWSASNVAVWAILSLCLFLWI
jgi:hypothetical protein